MSTTAIRNLTQVIALITVDTRKGLYTATVRTPDGNIAGFGGTLDDIFQGIVAHAAPWGADTADIWQIVKDASRRTRDHYARDHWGSVGITRH